MRIGRALAGGIVGACVLTLIHQAARGRVPHAPRADVLGRRAVAAVSRGVGRTQPSPANLERAALAADLLSNSLYYSLVGLGDPRGAWVRGAALGLAAGAAAVALPKPLGLGGKPTARTPRTAAMTVAWYLAGGLAAAAACRLLAGAGVSYERFDPANRDTDDEAVEAVAGGVRLNRGLPASGAPIPASHRASDLPM